jgi:predicted amidohydrolase
MLRWLLARYRGVTVKSIRIGLAQCRQTDDLASNRRTIFRYLEDAARQDVQIVCFPETQTVGYRVDIATPETVVVPAALEALHDEIVNRCGSLGMACILGTETPVDGAKPYNTALVISEHGEVLGTHHKTRLTPLDRLAYSAGERIETFVAFGVRIGGVICFEGFRFPEATRECVRQGAQVIFHPQNNTTRPNDWKIPVHHALITARAAENTVWFASCNACLIPHQNCRSMVVAPDGQLHAQTDLREEALLVADIDVDRATRAMFAFDLDGAAEVLFGETVKPDEYAAARNEHGA